MDVIGGRRNELEPALDATILVLYDGESEWELSPSISPLVGQLDFSMTRASCDRDSPMVALYADDDDESLASDSIAAARADEAQVIAAIGESRVELHGVLCGARHFYAIGDADSALNVRFVREEVHSPALKRNDPFVRVWLASAQDGRELSAKAELLFESSTDFALLEPTAANSGKKVLVVERIGAPFYYAITLQRASCSIGNEPADNNIALTVGDAWETASICPEGDRDNFVATIQMPGMYRVTIERGTYSSRTDGNDPYFYLSATVTSQASAGVQGLACIPNFQRLEEPSHNCTLPALAGSLRLEARIDRDTMDGYRVRLQPAGRCFESGPNDEVLNELGATIGNAPVLEAGKLAYFSVCGNEPSVRYFQVAGVTVATKTFSLTQAGFFGGGRQAQALYDTELSLVGPDGTPVDGGAAIWQESKASTFSSAKEGRALPVFAQDGPFYLRVRRFNHTNLSTPPQLLQIRCKSALGATASSGGGADSLWRAPTDDLPDCEIDPIAASTAYAPITLPIGDNQRVFSLCPAGDVDFFRFELPSTGT